MAPTRAHERLLIHQSKFPDFNICRLMAEKAMHDRDYRAQLERSAYGHDKTKELSKLNVEIEKGMVALRQKYLDDETEALAKLHYRTSKVEKGRNMVASRDSTTRNREGWVAGNICGGRKRPSWIGIGTATFNARRALTMLAANQRIQADSRPFPFMKLPAELRTQVYQELLVGGGQNIIVSASDGLSWAPSCKIESTSVYGKDITTVILRANRCIHDEALPVLYQSHVFDFGIDVYNIAPFFNQVSSAARQSVHGIHMELLRYGINPPPRSVPGRDIHDNCVDWSSACEYIASHLRVKEISFNINFTIHHDFQRFRWVKDLAQMHGLKRVFHHNSPNQHGLKSNEVWVLQANRMSRHDWGTDEYRWETLLKYLDSKMVDHSPYVPLGADGKPEATAENEISVS